MAAETRSSLPSLETPQSLLYEYFANRSQTFVYLKAIQQQVWESAKADEHFAAQRKRADECDKRQQKSFLRMMQNIGRQMQEATGALQLGKKEPWILDICMAPGGFSKQMLYYNPGANLRGFSLPRESGGHLMCLNTSSDRVQVMYTDVTLLAQELGLTREEVPDNHPDAANLMFGEVPILNHRFDVVICDGQVLRTHKRADYREPTESTRLACAQLILALRHMTVGGTFVMLLHQVDQWRSVELLNMFDQISEIQLFKSEHYHRTRGSFYLVAQNVQPQSAVALAAIEKWQKSWKTATLDVTASTAYDKSRNAQEVSHVLDVLERFGDKFVNMAEPIWQIQGVALAGAPYMNP